MSGGISSAVKNADETDERELDQKTLYQFEVFRANMVFREYLGAQLGSSLGETQTAQSLAIKKFTAGIGNLKRVTQLEPNGRKVSETINHYLHDDLLQYPPDTFFSMYQSRLIGYRYQGFLQERVSEIKRIQNSGANYNGVKATFTAKEDYPCIQTGQTVVNYLNRTQVRSENLEFDFFSGSLTKTVEIDAYGNRIMTERIPAHKIYPAMGIKVPASGNKNMLSQTAGSYMYKVDAANSKIGLISAEAQTWSNITPVRNLNNVHLVQNTPANGDVWRMQASYRWLPVNKSADGMTAVGVFSDFNWSNPTSSNANWKKSAEITLYDPYSKGLEERDLLGVYSANRFDYGNKKIILSGSNSKYFEMAYGGAEDDGINQTFHSIVKKGDGVVTTAAAHTGLRSVKLGVSGKKGLLYSPVTNDLTIGRDYVISVWVKPVTGTASDVKLFYDIDGVVKATASSNASLKAANGWTLVTLQVNGADIVANKILTFGCRNDHSTAEAYVDDIRFQPLNSTTTAYVYDAFSGELTYILDNGNVYTKYEYDASGRLLRVFKEKIGTGVFKSNEYQYNSGPGNYAAPPLIYSKITYNFQTTTYSGANNCVKTHHFNVFIKFFSDPACTVPMTVSNLPVRYVKEVEAWNGTSSTPYDVFIGSTPVNQYLIGSFPVIVDDRCANSDSRTEFDLTPSVDYVIKAAANPTPPTVYAKMTKTYTGSDIWEGCYYGQVYTAAVNFYSDQACTIPFALNHTSYSYWFKGTHYTHTIGATFVTSAPVYMTPAVLNITQSNCNPPTTGSVQCQLAFNSNYTIVP